MNIQKRMSDINARVLDLTADVFVQDNQAKVLIGFKNCCYGTIKAIKILAKGYNSFSENVIVDGKDSFIILIQDLSIHPLESAANVISDLPDNEIRKVQCTIQQICYEDGSIVNADAPNVIEYEVECLQMVGSEFDDEISEKEQLKCLQKTRRNAICYPKDIEQGWVCICGQLNKVQNKKCICCGAEKDEVFDYYNKENVLKRCEQERRRKAAEKKQEEERKEREEKAWLEQRRIKELIEQKKKKQRIAAGVTAVILVILSIVLYRVHYVHTYGMDKETYQQWENALEAYADWKKEVNHLYYGERGYFDQIKDGNSNYSYSEIHSMTSLNLYRNKLLDKVGEIEQIEGMFPEKYKEVFSTLCKYQKLYYIMDVDVTASTYLAEDFMSDTYERENQLHDDILRIEGYLENEYLNLDKIDLGTDVGLSYAPKTFSYSYSNNEIYKTNTMSSSEMSSAKKVADEYCQVLMDKQPSIDTITYTGTSSSSGSYAYFEYKVKYTNGTTREGTVTVSKYADSFEATGMDMED